MSRADPECKKGDQWIIWLAEQRKLQIYVKYTYFNHHMRNHLGTFFVPKTMLIEFSPYSSGIEFGRQNLTSVSPYLLFDHSAPCARISYVTMVLAVPVSPV